MATNTQDLWAKLEQMEELMQSVIQEVSALKCDAPSEKAIQGIKHRLDALKHAYALLRYQVDLITTHPAAAHTLSVGAAQGHLHAQFQDSIDNIELALSQIRL
jgi:hypothetical protein